MTEERARHSFWTDVWSFGREILIVVIGVALGLWAQQLASEAGWRETVASAKQDMRRELGEAADIAAVIVAGSPCTDAYVARARALALGQTRRALPELAGVYLLLPQDAAWEAASSSQALGHLSHSELEDYAFAYSQIRVMREAVSPLAEQLAILRTLNMPRATLDPATVQQLLMASAQLEQMEARQFMVATDLIDHLQGPQRIKVTAEGLATGARIKAQCLKAGADVGALAPAEPQD